MDTTLIVSFNLFATLLLSPVYDVFSQLTLYPSLHRTTSDPSVVPIH